MRLFSLLLAALLFIVPVQAAEFDIDSGRVILRRLQYCTDCGSALLVTHVNPGTLIRCPDCGHEQRRIGDEHVLSQLYQVCKTCQAPLDPTGHHPGDPVECANCHTRQPLTADAFSLSHSGPGYAPGMPPGTNKKTLLLSANKPDAPINIIPLDDTLADLSEVRNDLALITRPPTAKVVVREEVRRKQYPPIPELPSTGAATPRRDEPRTEQQASAAPDETPPASAPARAVDVPAVTADLFGKRHDGGADGAYIPAGKILARVNGEPIHAREVERVVGPVVRRLREQASPEDAAAITAREQALRREVLERLIDRELAVREAEAIGFSPDPTAVRERETELAPVLAGTGLDIRREAFRDVVMNAMRKRYAEKPGSASPEAVREFYRQNRDSRQQPRLIALDQLVIFEDRQGRTDSRDYESIALEIAQQLEQGARFDEVRDKYDEFAPTAGIPHVEPALQEEGVFSNQVLASAGDLRRGAVFGPLFMPGMALYGKVTDVRPAGPIPFEEVKNEIRRRLEEQAAEKNLDEWLKRLRSKARVEIAE